MLDLNSIPFKHTQTERISGNVGVSQEIWNPMLFAYWFISFVINFHYVEMQCALYFMYEYYKYLISTNNVASICGSKLPKFNILGVLTAHCPQILLQIIEEEIRKLFNPLTL